jgi:predicted transcriptional regulator of viral defense system
VDKNLRIYYNMYMKNSRLNTQDRKNEKIFNFFLERKGIASVSELKNRGVHYRDIKALLEKGPLIKIKSGRYRYVDATVSSNQGFVDIAFSVPGGVICLLSALSYYELTTFNPSTISVAIPRNTWKPKIEYPPVEFFYFSKEQFRTGIDEVKIGDVNVRIYCPEKTICDCFRYRNKLGLDVAREGLLEYLKKKDRSLEKLLKYSEICRLKSVMQTWLNAVI